MKRSALTVDKIMTTDEYLRTPESLVPTELVWGVLRVADSPIPRHQAAVFDLAVALREHVRARHLGDVWISPLDVILDASRHLVVQPDLFFLSNERSHILTDRFRGAPDLIVEVLSPDPRIGKLDERLSWFAEYDVRECWLLHLFERRLEVLNFANGAVTNRTSFDEQARIASTVLPDFERSLEAILRWN